MRKYIIIMALLLFIGCTKTAPIKEDTYNHEFYTAISTIPADLLIPVVKAQMFGTEISMQVVAAWAVMDFLSDKNDFKQDKRLRGWVIEHVDIDMSSEIMTDLSMPSGRMIVTFVGDIEGEFKGLYQVETEFGEVFEKTYLASLEGFELTSNQLSMFKARQTAINSGIKACSRRNIAAVMKFNDRKDDHNIVYLLAGPLRFGEIIAGGNFELMLSESGEDILKKNSLSESCAVLQKTGEVEALTLNHIFEPTPNAVHVFLSLYHQTPIYIKTTENNIVWKVDGNKISIVES